MSHKNTPKNAEKNILNTCNKMIKDIDELKKIHR